jgi:transposase InsO family protein
MDTAVAVVTGRGFAVKRVAATLGVSRSQLTERLKRSSKARSSYRVADDGELLGPLRSLVDERPTYGYRRITALLNRERLKTGLSRLNHKRIYRLMSQNGMLLQRYTGKPPGRLHDGKIITIRPNLRWTSDGFEVPCWSGEVIRVAFALDTCDREVIAWCSSTRGISGEMIRDLMVESVERRFGSDALPHPVQWLSDNGSCYRANETIDFATQLGLVPCFTPVRSPQSNGMAESFVKTFKRDYVYVHDRPDAQTVLSQLAAWFEDYNESHPHKALRMKSPREFIRSYQPAACPV